MHISDLVLDPDTPYHFDEIKTLRPRQVVPLAPTNALTKAISRNIVKQALSVAPPTTAWPLRITWRSDEGRRFESCWEILVLRLPLEISCHPVGCSRAGAALTP